MQEQHKLIEDLTAKNEDLQNQLNDIKAYILKNGGTLNPSSGILKQNTPNPVNSNTVIRYLTANDARNAQILITDMKGSLLKTYNVSKGEGQLTISADELPGGTYNYTLYVNNSKIATKQMIIVK